MQDHHAWPRWPPRHPQRYNCCSSSPPVVPSGTTRSHARRKLRRLSQHLLTLSHVLDHIAQEWVHIGRSTHGGGVL